MIHHIIAVLFGATDALRTWEVNYVTMTPPKYEGEIRKWDGALSISCDTNEAVHALVLELGRAGFVCRSGIVERSHSGELWIGADLHHDGMIVGISGPHRKLGKVSS